MDTLKNALIERFTKANSHLFLSFEKLKRFITTLRGHVSRVYQLSWSSDSRLLVSGSADSTLKVWSIKNQKLWNDLPGHLDEVYAVDWSPSGEHVSSGGKDKLMKM